MSCTLQGSNEVILRLDPEAGSAFERLMQERVPVLREALEKLSSEHGGHRSDALSAIRKAKNASFDKAPFLPVVRELIADGKHLVQSLGVLRIVGGDASDVPLVARYKDHEKQMVRASVGYVLIGLDWANTNPTTGETVLELLKDPGSVVRTTTYKAMNGFATTPEIDARLIEMSAGADSRLGGEAYDVVYYALRSLPLIRKPMAERLIGLIHPKSTMKYWAVWGLSRHKATDDARPLIVEALQAIVDSQSSGYQYGNAKRGLKLHQQ